METHEKSAVYLDYNATTPLAKEVIDGITKSLIDDWGNPSSSYKLGTISKSRIEASRMQVAEMLNANPNDIVFTSGGTESNNIVISSVIKDYFGEGYRRFYAREEGLPHIITTNVEHDSVMKVLTKCETYRGDPELHRDNKLTVVRVDPNGCVNIEAIMREIRPMTCLISVMHANNETGIIMPIKELAERIRLENDGPTGENGRTYYGLPKIYFHTDAAQTIGKIPVDVQQLNVDYLTIVGHKFYGPRVGALYVKGVQHDDDGYMIGMTPIYSMVHGGGQERGFRSGTENTPMIVGLGIAAQLVSKNIAKYEADMKKCREHFETELLRLIPNASVNFISNENRLPNTISVAVPEPFSGREILESCAGEIDASLGAACHSHNVDSPSRILRLSGLSDEVAKRTIRFSVGRTTTMEEIDLAMQVLTTKCKSD